MKTPTTEYRNIEITYDYAEDVWRFTLRGRDKTATSLRLAREAIDKPAPKESTFAHFPAFHKTGNWDDPTYEAVTVTGDGGPAPDYQGGREVWIRDSKKKRTKEPINSIFADTPENRALLTIINEQVEIREQSKEHMNEAERKLTRITITEEQ